MHATSNVKLRDQRSVSIAITDSPLLSSNIKRCGIVLTAPPTNRYTISFNGPAVLDQGITMYPGQQPLVLNCDDYGDALQGDIRAISAVAPQNVTAMDIMYK